MRSKNKIMVEKGAAAPLSTWQNDPLESRTMSKVTRRRWPPSARALDALIAGAIVDAYGDDEQRVGFLTMLEERLEMPFEVQILGTTEPSRCSRHCNPPLSGQLSR